MPVAALVAAFALGACGEDDFENDPRPPAPIELTARIADDDVKRQPEHRQQVGAGLATITISNQSQDPAVLVLEGPTDDASDEIVAGGTGGMKIALEEGDYTVSAARTPTPREAQLEVGPERAELAERPAAALVRGLRRRRFGGSAAATSASIRASSASTSATIASSPSRGLVGARRRSRSASSGSPGALGSGPSAPPRRRRGRRPRRPRASRSRAISTRPRRAVGELERRARPAPRDRRRRSACCPRTRCSCSRPAGTFSSPATTSTAKTACALGHRRVELRPRPRSWRAACPWPRTRSGPARAPSAAPISTTVSPFLPPPSAGSSPVCARDVAAAGGDRARSPRGRAPRT